MLSTSHRSSSGAVDAPSDFRTVPLVSESPWLRSSVAAALFALSFGSVASAHDPNGDGSRHSPVVPALIDVAPTSAADLFDLLILRGQYDSEVALVEAVLASDPDLLDYAVVDVAEFETIDFDPYDAIYLPTIYDPEGSPFLAAIDTRADDLAAFVEAGGGILALLQLQVPGNPWGWALGDVVNLNTNILENTVEIVAPDHPVLHGIETADLNGWTYTSHDDYLRWSPVLLSAIVSNESSGEAAILVGEPEEGRVVYSNLDPDLHTGFSGAIELARNALAWVGGNDSCAMELSASWNPRARRPLSFEVTVHHNSLRDVEVPLTVSLSDADGVVLWQRVYGPREVHTGDVFSVRGDEAPEVDLVPGTYYVTATIAEMNRLDGEVVEIRIE